MITASIVDIDINAGDNDDSGGNDSDDDNIIKKETKHVIF